MATQEVKNLAFKMTVSLAALFVVDVQGRITRANMFRPGGIPAFAGSVSRTPELLECCFGAKLGSCELFQT